MFGLKSILFFCALHHAVSAKTDDVNKIKVTAPGQCINTERIIRVLTIIGQKQCIRKCLQNGQCKSVNYKRQQLHCELTAALYGDSESSLVLDSECDYIEMENQTLELAGSCKSSSCEGQCTVLSSEKAFCIPGRCAAGWVRFENKCYLFNHTSQNWTDADSVCQGFNSILAEPRTEAESKFLINQAYSLGGAFWIGLTDIAEEGIWVYSSDQRNITIKDFAENEPNHGKAGNCLHLWPDFRGQWADNPCSGRSKFICEKNVTHIE
ncbi:perlucin-like protein [Saccostrea cucullata]|uniref:perlucin-like protein n=1 Tax=Saccostrea cuccullata TaxID=36930 RepID=UPI002ED5DBF7